MCTIIAISNQKGGVGKTTTTSGLAVGFRSKGFRVLAIDLDPQGNLSYNLQANNEENPTSYHLLRGDVTAKEAIQKTEVMDVIAANISLSAVELEFTSTGREYLLKEALRPIWSDYDYILLDTPPALGILTVNAFTAATHIIVPMIPDIFSLQGITQLYDTVERVKKYCNPALKIEGILLTKFNGRTILSREIKGTAVMIAEKLQIPLLNTCIRNSVAISEAQSMQESMLDYSPRNNAVMDYMTLVDELLERGI